MSVFSSEAQSQKSELSRDQAREFLTEVIQTPAGKVDEQPSLCERLASPNVVQQIENACLDDDVHRSGVTRRSFFLWGFRGWRSSMHCSDISIMAEIHIQVYTSARPSYHGSVLLDPEDGETVYFEVKNRLDINPILP